jgi:hypothetical protein
MKVHIELTRSTDAEDLAQWLTAQGVQAEVLSDPVRVTAVAEDFAAVEHAVEAWTAERELPFVPMHVDDRHVVLSPPGS